MPLDLYKREFIEFMVRSEVLQFGDFVTKSGRSTPYFIDTGRYRTGQQLDRLARFYARAIIERIGREFDVLFGPAYKGIPLVVATALALVHEHNYDVAYCYDRKEAKDHGERGSLVGHQLRDGDRVLIIDDVATAGTSVQATVPLLRAAAEIDLVALVVSVDRRERGQTDHSALDELADFYEMDTFAIVSVDEVMEHLQGRRIDGRLALSEEQHGRMVEYLAEFGAGRGRS